MGLPTPALDIPSLAVVAAVVVVLAHVVPYILDSHAMRKYPGPLLARLSDIWLGRIAALGHRSEVVHGLHQKYGQFSGSVNALSC